MLNALQLFRRNSRTPVSVEIKLVDELIVNVERDKKALHVKRYLFPKIIHEYRCQGS